MILAVVMGLIQLYLPGWTVLAPRGSEDLVPGGQATRLFTLGLTFRSLGAPLDPFSPRSFARIVHPVPRAPTHPRHQCEMASGIHPGDSHISSETPPGRSRGDGPEEASLQRCLGSRVPKPQQTLVICSLGAVFGVSALRWLPSPSVPRVR